MNGLAIFENPKFGKVRTLERDGEPWFVGKDVAVALGYENPQRAIRNHVDDEDKGVTEMVTPAVSKNPHHQRIRIVFFSDVQQVTRRKRV